jgi:hypothetical protein
MIFFLQQVASFLPLAPAQNHPVLLTNGRDRGSTKGNAGPTDLLV